LIFGLLFYLFFGFGFVVHSEFGEVKRGFKSIKQNFVLNSFALCIHQGIQDQVVDSTCVSVELHKLGQESAETTEHQLTVLGALEFMDGVDQAKRRVPKSVFVDHAMHQQTLAEFSFTFMHVNSELGHRHFVFLRVI